MMINTAGIPCKIKCNLFSLFFCGAFVVSSLLFRAHNVVILSESTALDRHAFAPLPGPQSAPGSHTATPWGWRGRPSVGVGTGVADGSSDGIAVCLLIRDDNDRLPEWLAYHYQTLPLLHLVVAVDPGGAHSPRRILDRWAGSNMNITLWENETDYIPPRQMERMKCNDRKPGRRRLRCHIPRQRHFVKNCLQYHKKNGRRWIALIDTDEFIVFNRAHHDEIDIATSLAEDVRAERRSPTIPTSGGDVTALDHILAQKEDFPWGPSDNPCVVLPRLRFGAVESDPQMVYNGTGILGNSTAGAVRPADPAALDTLRFRHHAARGAARPNKYRKYDPNSFGKPLVDLSRVPAESLEKLPLGPHSPIPQCKDFGLNGSYRTSLLRVHHYLGSRERYFGRKGDTRRNDEKFDRDAALSDGEDDDIRPWFQNFVKEAGNVRAKELLAEG